MDLNIYVNSMYIIMEQFYKKTKRKKQSIKTYTYIKKLMIN
jgi:hypothetical protein